MSTTTPTISTVDITVHRARPAAHRSDTTLWISVGDNITLFLADATVARELGEKLIADAKKAEQIYAIDREHTEDVTT